MPSVPLSTIAPYAIAAVLILVLGGRRLAGRQDAAPAAATPAVAHHVAASADPAGASAVSLSTSAGSAVVDVAGAVRRPGVYRLRAGARVRDALQHAGGATRRANTAAVNLAAKVTDGQQIVVPERAVGIAAAPAPSAGASGAMAVAPISLNSATLEQLDTLQGVGPSTAQKILDWRTQNGGFASVDDLAQIPGIGPKKLEALRPQVTP